MESNEIGTKIAELQQIKESLEKTIRLAEEKKREVESVLQSLAKIDSASMPQAKAEEAKKVLVELKEPTLPRKNQKISTGISKIDELLLGGLPMPSNVVLFGAPFTSKETLAYNFMANSVRENIPVVIITADKDLSQIKYEISQALSVDEEVVEGFEEDGMIRFVDVYSKSIQSQSSSKRAVVIDNISNLSVLLKSVENIEQEILKTYPYYRLVFISLTAFIPQFDEKVFMKFTQQFTQKRKANRCTAMYMLEDGLFDQKVFETISYIMDGTIEFKIVNTKQYVKVVGLSNARTREWVEVYNRGVTFNLGSFSLERVR